MIRRTTGDSEDLSTVDPAERYHALCTIYNFYSPKLCQRFGTARVMSAYDYSDQVTDITATRHRKIVFCSMLMDEHPFVSRIFGMELSRMSFDAGIAQERLGILDGVGVNTSLLESFELPTGEIKRFGNLNSLVSVIAGDENGFHKVPFGAKHCS